MSNRWEEFERFGNLIESVPFQFAKTMPQNPHHYTLRKNWGNNDDFVWAVTFLRENGYQAYYQGRKYIQIDVNDKFYWTMGAPMASTVLINRKPKEYQAPYNEVSAIYDSIFVDEKSADEDREVMDIIGDVSSLSVLDVGCGTGLFLDYKSPDQYTGIDISSGMINRLKQKHPTANVINTSLASFVGGRYDLVLALFGSASYLSYDEVERLPKLIRSGGRVIAMFYDQGYHPHTHAVTGIHAQYTPFRWQLTGKTRKIDGAVLVDMQT